MWRLPLPKIGLPKEIPGTSATLAALNKLARGDPALKPTSWRTATTRTATIVKQLVRSALPGWMAG